MVQINIIKSPVPIVWLDTSILIRLARLTTGKAENDKDRDRVLALRARIQDLARANKLICPEGEQDAEHLNQKSSFSDVLTDLSLGIRAKHPLTVQAKNIERAMRAFVSNKNEIKYSYQDLFDCDPCEELFEANSRSFIVTTVNTPSKEYIDKISESRKEIHSGWEKLRKQFITEGVKFDGQLKREIRGSYAVIFEEAKAFISKMTDGRQTSYEEWECFAEARRLAFIYKSIAESENTSKSIAEFFASKYYVSIPSVEISTKLTASMLTDNRKIRSGDQMDIEHVSAFLPYAHMMVVDKSMKFQIQKLNLDRQYSTKIVYVGDDEEVRAFFDSL